MWHNTRGMANGSGGNGRSGRSGGPHRSNGAGSRADGWRDEAWPLPTEAKGPFKADIRLNFRTYPKWVSDAVRAAEPSLPAPPIVQLNRLQLTLQPLPVTPDTEPQS